MNLHSAIIDALTEAFTNAGYPTHRVELPADTANIYPASAQVEIAGVIWYLGFECRDGQPDLIQFGCNGAQQYWELQDIGPTTIMDCLEQLRAKQAAHSAAIARLPGILAQMKRDGHF